MKLKSLIIGAAIVAASAGAQAGTFGVSLNQTAIGFWQANFDSDNISGPLLGGSPGVTGTDTITFQDWIHPLPTGMYEISLNLMELANGQRTTDPITMSAINLNGLPVSYQAKRMFSIDGNSTPPFVLSLTGATNLPDVGYHGSLTVTAVPEPETYAMLLAGLGLMAGIARRRQNKQG